MLRLALLGLVVTWGVSLTRLLRTQAAATVTVRSRRRTTSR